MRLLPIALCFALLAFAAPAVASTSPPVPDLHWRDCDGGFECATAKVPLDYAHPHARTVRLAVIRHRALDPEHRIGSLFLNNGGPGMSAVDFVRTAPPPAFGLLARFDWVGFDPRGVGGSVPAIDCDELPDTRAMTPDTFDLHTMLARGRAIARRCLNRDPRFLASLTTANAARDLDLMRAAVGDSKLNYYGLSWGGVLGETYTSLFPGRTRAIVLDSSIDGDVWLNRPARALEEHHAGFEAALGRFLAATGRTEAEFDALVARLDAHPIDIGDGHRVDGQVMEAIAFVSFYSGARWPRLDAALTAADNGDAATLRAIADVALDDDKLTDLVQTYLSVEQRWPRHRLRPYIEHGERQFALTPHFGAGAYEDVHNLFWPIHTRRAFYGPFTHSKKAPPVLVIHSTNDPVTPIAWGKAVTRDLGNARLLTAATEGHGVVVDFEPCVLGPVQAYFNDLELPPADACATARAARRASPAAPWLR
jgi:pimeloyl-ACP methyl ester carboxylesterase